MIDVKKLYDTRFNKTERIRKNELWKVLCTDFLQQFVRGEDTLLDVGAGQCEFINNIRAKRKIAIDVNEELAGFADKEIELRISPVKQLRSIFEENSLDVIFISNLLEHLDSKEDVFRLLNEAYSILKPEGRILIMQPDIALVGNEYWDFFDHKVPLTYASILEVLIAIGFTIQYTKYPFLPYTTRTRHLPLWPVLLKIYLKVRLLHYLFGKQFFVCGKK